MKLCILLGFPDTDCSSGIILSKYLVRKKTKLTDCSLKRVTCFQLLGFLLLNLIAARYNYDELVFTVDHYMYQLLGKLQLFKQLPSGLIAQSDRIYLFNYQWKTQMNQMFISFAFMFICIPFGCPFL